MRTTIILATALCLLSGCKIESGTTTITNVSIDGKANNVMRSFVSDGSGEFECIKSISGRCHYLLFVKDCRANAGRPGDGRRCINRTVQAFTLQAGTTKHLGNLPPRLQQCVSHEASPAAPDCLASQG